MNKYSYLIFSAEGSVFPSDLCARANSVSEALLILNCPELANKDSYILRYNDEEVGLAFYAGEFRVADLAYYPNAKSEQLVKDLRDQSVIEEVVFASINFYNCVRLKQLGDGYKAWKILIRDREQTIRILKVQLEVLYGVVEESESLTAVLTKWWETLRSENNIVQDTCG